jgi:hypothetical protein
MTVKAIDVGLQYAAATEHTTQGGYWAHVTASGVVVAQPCQIIGFYVNQTTAGTIQLFDNASAASNPIGAIITPALGMQWLPAIFLNGLFVNVAGTALDVTFFYVK